MAASTLGRFPILTNALRRRWCLLRIGAKTGYIGHLTPEYLRRKEDAVFDAAFVELD